MHPGVGSTLPITAAAAGLLLPLSPTILRMKKRKIPPSGTSVTDTPISPIPSLHPEPGSDSAMSTLWSVAAMAKKLDQAIPVGGLNFAHEFDPVHSDMTMERHEPPGLSPPAY